MKKILGLDIGTNSIGWAFIESNAYDDNVSKLEGKIIQLGSRIIPMDADAMTKFEKGTPESNATGRRTARGARRLNQRYKLRRGRLIETLQILGWLPENFPNTRKNPKIFKRIEKHSINDYLPFSEDLKKEARDFFGIVDRKTTSDEDYQIPEDWIIYLLKTKALKGKITLSELARILYHYNQRRGFKSSRKDAKQFEENKEIKFPIIEKWIEFVKITEISNLGKGEGKDKDFTFYELSCKAKDFEFKAIKKRKNPLDWLQKIKEVEISRKTIKDGTITYNISEVDPKEFDYRKKALEKDIENSGLTISEYYLENIRKEFKDQKAYKIKQRIVDRSKYQNEFVQIWNKQMEYYSTEFADQNKINSIAESLYFRNDVKQKELKGKSLFYILFNDIIYFQRKLKSQKSQIASCTYETKNFKNKNGANIGVKVANRSNPFFQEFRIWQTLHNLRVVKKEDTSTGKLLYDIDVSSQYLTVENKEKLFELFDTNKEITHDSVLLTIGFKKDRVENGEKAFSYKLNYPDSKAFVGNETKSLFLKVFKKYNYLEKGKELLENKEFLYRLWHIIYSLPEEADIKKALSNKLYFDLPLNVIEGFAQLPEFPTKYASLSQKAIQNLLPLMRLGKYWKAELLENKPKNTKIFDERPNLNLVNRAEVLLAKVLDKLPDKARQEIEKRELFVVENLQGLPTYLAAYIAYGRHSERANEEKYENINDFKINELIPYNSLRNPVVEKVIRETLKLVKEIWKEYDRPDFIHVELGRELKKNNEERRGLTDANEKNRIEKERIIKLIQELKYENYNPESPADNEKVRLWKEQAGAEGNEKFEELFKGGKAEFVAGADVEKYRLWAEQSYRSPYSGKAIPLSWLFANPKKVEIDHIIPRSKFYDDSMANKVLVEAEFNSEKGNMLAIEFIEQRQNTPIHGTDREVLDLESYKTLVDEMFQNTKKKKHLKLYDIPEDFVNRQLNDTKYISNTVSQFLRPVAKGKIDEISNDEGLVYTNGSITSELKNKWGLNKLWKQIILPRFERYEIITGEKLIFENETRIGEYHFAKDYKRIDHRHHALDALIIACTSRKHIKYLNTLNAYSNNKNEKAKFDEWQKWKYLLNFEKSQKKLTQGMTEFELPWSSFYNDSFSHLKSLIVSQKQSNKLISNTKNAYTKFLEKDGAWSKGIAFQAKPKDDDKYWVAVRQSLFGQPLGKIHLPEYTKNVDLNRAIKAQIKFIAENREWNSDSPRIAISTLRKKVDCIIKSHNYVEKSILQYFRINPLTNDSGQPIENLDLLYFKKYASKRVNIDETFTEDKIEKLPNAHLENNWLSRILKNHLKEYGNKPNDAFKGEALEELYNKAPYPINKVTRKEGGNKIELNNKLLDGDAGVNQYFIVEITKFIDKKTGLEKILRKYSTPPFLECIERLAKGLPIHDDNPDSKYIILSPGDVVYVPRENENINWNNKSEIAERLYIMKSSNASTCYFLPLNVSSLIGKGEFESLGKSEKTSDGTQIIKANFIKMKINSLGQYEPIQI